MLSFLKRYSYNRKSHLTLHCRAMCYTLFRSCFKEKVCRLKAMGEALETEEHSDE